jgi:hypothetical protein
VPRAVQRKKAVSELSELIHIVALATDANPDRGRLDLRSLSRGETKLLLRTLKALEGISDPAELVAVTREMLKKLKQQNSESMYVDSGREKLIARADAVLNGER